MEEILIFILINLSFSQPPSVSLASLKPTLGYSFIISFTYPIPNLIVIVIHILILIEIMHRARGSNEGIVSSVWIEQRIVQVGVS
jgi:hypothetical protein